MAVVIQTTKLQIQITIKSVQEQSCIIWSECLSIFLHRFAQFIHFLPLSEINRYGNDYEYPNHPQSTQHQKNDRCPPPPQMLPERACEVPGCRSDSECERHKRCCYNGCIYACLESVQPPPVLDWLVQPKPRWLGGNGWLLDGPEEVLQAEACSTTEDGDEPLHCPTGYECHIINPGNPAAGIPNRGQCIKQRSNSDGRGLKHKYYKDYKDYLGSNTNNAVGY
uniref:WAP four-disulfide core domain protein 1 n=1 Tax=Periophthalmus magnuspinnatus TaxID=409849 RepID=A0A3B4AV38_9GOBI